METKVEDKFQRVTDAAERATFRNIGHGAATIRNEAIESIVPGGTELGAGFVPAPRYSLAVPVGLRIRSV